MLLDWTNTIKWPILPKAIYRFNADPIKIPTHFLTDFERTILIFTWKDKNPKIVKIILNNKRIAGGLTIPNFRVIVKRTTWN